MTRWEERDCGYVTPCHVWTGARGRDGYGRVKVGGRRGRCRLAHQLAYEAANGPVPPGLQLDHLCRNRPCVRADHLEVVTGAENTRRGARAKLTHDDVAEVRELLANGSHTQGEIAALFGVSRPTVCHINRGAAWVGVG